MFNVKYLGMTLVGQPKGEDMASAAIRRIVATVSHWLRSDSYNRIMVMLFYMKVILTHCLTNHAFCTDISSSEY